MDPKACLIRYLDALRDSDSDEIEASADDYNGWITRGGFPARLADGRCVWGLSSNPNGDSPYMCPVSHSDLETGEENDGFLTPAQIRGAL